jgi:hypothetical protein
MPSPVGHALAGIAAGYLLGGGAVDTPTTRSSPCLIGWKHLFHKRFVVFGLLGILPDIDFLFGVHSTYTHSVGAIVVVGLVSGLGGRHLGSRRYLAAGAAYGSHVVLDWLGSDTVAPLGVMALWPLSSDFYLSDRHWFMAVCREYWVAECWWHNARGLIREVMALGTVTLGAIVASRVLKH